MHKPFSLTSRLTIEYTLSSVGLVLIATLYLYWSLVRALDYREEKFFSSKMEALQALLNRDDEGEALRYRIMKEWSALTAEVFYVRLFDAKGKILAETPGATHIFALFPNPGDKAVQQDFQLEERAFRALSSPLMDESESYIVQIILDRTDQSTLLEGYRNRLVLVLLACSFGCVLFYYRIARRGLRPLQNMAQAAAKITFSNLDERIVDRKMPSDLAHLARTFDAMLDRLKDAFDRLQRFSADIAHELRTPINNITGELQVALGKNRPVEYYKDAIGSCLEECSRLSQIIDSLLFLARSENPSVDLSRESIDLRKELESVLEFYEVAAAEKGISCTLDASAQITVNVEKTLFQRAMANLLSNAIKHTEPGGKIRITAEENQGQVKISVVDSGVGIPKEHLPYLFDRFYRVDASRSKDSGGSGLGLAIVKSIANTFGGDVGVQSDMGVGTRVQFQFPTRRARPAASITNS